MRRDVSDVIDFAVPSREETVASFLLHFPYYDAEQFATLLQML